MRENDPFTGGFAAGLLDPRVPVPARLTGPCGKQAHKRYAIYRNNVTVSLIEALRAVFPVTEKLTGAAFFREMARSHLRACPPRSPLLFEYGQDFAAFVEGYGPARGLAWLADVARIERAWLDAYHAADGPVVGQDCLAGLDPAEMLALTFTLHPAVRVLRSDFSARTIFWANLQEAPMPEIDASQPQDSLVTRPDFDVLVSALPPGGAIFALKLAEGASLGSAAEDTLALCPSMDLAAVLRILFVSGAFSAVSSPTGKDTP